MTAIDARELMTSAVLTVTPEQSLEDAHRLMLQRTLRHLPVVSEEKLVGIVSDRDVLLAISRGPDGSFVYPLLTVAEVMTSHPMVARPGSSAAHLAKTMVDAKLSALPIVSTEGALIGLVTATDLVRLLSLIPRNQEHQANDKTLADVKALVEGRSFQSASKRLGDLRLALERHLDTEGRLVPIFIDRTGDPSALADRLRSEHAEIPRRLEALCEAVTHWETDAALGAVEQLTELLNAHHETESELLHPALDDLVSEDVDWEGLRYHLFPG